MTLKKCANEIVKRVALEEFIEDLGLCIEYAENKNLTSELDMLHTDFDTYKRKLLSQVEIELLKIGETKLIHGLVVEKEFKSGYNYILEDEND